MSKQTPTQNKPQTKAAIYCRVSTYEQGKGDFSSLDSQQAMLRHFCETKGYVISDVYSDTESGTTLEREHLQRLLQDAQAGKFNVLVATKLDRVSRSVKDFLDLDEALNKFGVDIIITTQNIDTTTAQGKMQRTILMAFAQFERDMIAERTREKLYSQAKEGYWGGGHVPLGYDVVDKKLIQSPKESEIVKQIFSEYLITPSTVKVAKWLNDKGDRTKTRVSKAGKTTGGSEFSNQLVHDILRNKTYIGLVTFKDESFKGLHDPIVDEDLFEKVAKRLDESITDRFGTYEDTPLLLLGLTKCGVCGGQMTTFFSQKKDTCQRHFYYRCTTATKFGKQKCQSQDSTSKRTRGIYSQVAGPHFFR